jgi:hypothetical protein
VRLRVKGSETEKQRDRYEEAVVKNCCH